MSTNIKNSHSLSRAQKKRPAGGAGLKKRFGFGMLRWSGGLPQARRARNRDTGDDFFGNRDDPADG